MNIYLVTSGDSLSGGVGTYICDMKSLFKGAKLISDSSEADVVIAGLKRKLSLASIVKFIKFKYKNDGIYIFHSSSGILLSIIANLLPFSQKNIIVFHGLASRYSGYFAKCIEIIGYRLNKNNVFMNYDDPSFLGAKTYIYIPNYSKRAIANTSNINGDLVTVTRNSSQKDNKTLINVVPNLNGILRLYTNEKDAIFFKSKNVKNLITASTDVKDEIYNARSVFILSTFSEGFPLSIIEASCSGLPVLCSNLSILRGVLGDSVLYFNDELELQSKIDRLQSDPDFYVEMSCKSMMLAAEFTYERWRKSWSNLLSGLN